MNLNLSDDEFRDFSRLVYDKSGIDLQGGKKELVRARLTKRILKGGFAGFRDYYQYVGADQSGHELTYLLDAVSTNFTSFFREPRHFRFMIDRLIPQWKGIRKAPPKNRLRIWSAGCSTGQEPYSIVMIMLEKGPKLVAGDFKLLATDLSEKVINEARSGIYEAAALENIPPAYKKRYFQAGKGKWSGLIRVNERLRKIPVFRRLNLIMTFPFKGKFDLIFCRNVMIYFDKKTQQGLVSRHYDLLTDGGHLFIGHSESLSGIPNDFKYIQPTIYQRA